MRGVDAGEQPDTLPAREKVADMRAWRIAHGQGGPPGTSYMAQKAREARLRRREAMEVGGEV